MVSSLKTCGIEKMLYDLLQEIQKNRQKFANMGDELKRLITTFEKTFFSRTQSSRPTVHLDGHVH